MDVLRTPDERFGDLPDWPYEPRYLDIGDGLRVHYVDEGPDDGPTVLLTHGEPTWAYLYRHMVPGLVDAGCRVVAPDLVGFGRSDKPADPATYTYANHVDWLTGSIEALDLQAVTMFCQDWGGLLGLVHAARHADRYRAIVASNTGVPPGVDIPIDPDAPFQRWKRMAAEMDPFSASESVAGDSPLNQTGHSLTEAERAAYDAPFPDETFCAGPRRFPQIVPLTEADPGSAVCREAWLGLGSLAVPLVTAFGAQEDITAAMAPLLQGGIPGATGQPHRTIEGSGHFIQECQPAACVDVVLEMIDRTA